MSYHWEKDLEFALTGKQVSNHLVHGVAAALIAAVIGSIQPIFWFALPAVMLVGSMKELVECWSRVARGKEIHLIDSILDFAGWIVGGLIGWGLA